MDDRDRCKYAPHDQEHDERGGIQESHRRLHARKALTCRGPAVLAFAPSGLVEPLHVRRHDWQHLSSPTGTKQPQKKARLPPSLPGRPPRVFTAARPDPPAVFCVIVTSSE